MTDEEKKNGERGTHSDNDLTRVQKIMKDNNLPFYHSKTKDEDEDNETESRD